MIAAVEFIEVSKKYGVYIPDQKRISSSINGFRRTTREFHLSHGYYEQNPALISVSFIVGQGEILAIAGPSGSGKSTILRLIATRIQPDNGQLKLFGYDAAHLPEIVKRKINFPSLEGSFFRNLTPIENLLIFAREKKIAGFATYRRISETLDRLEISHEDQNTPMYLLSQADQIRVWIASSIFPQPQLLLLDEPIAKLDQAKQKVVLNTLTELRDQFDTSIVIATRFIDQALPFCDRMIFLDAGQVIGTKYPDIYKNGNLRINQHSSVKKPVAA